MYKKPIMSEILKFFVKRACILYAIALIICMMISGDRILMILSLTVGVILSLLRFAVLESVFKHLLSSRASKKQAVAVSLVIYLLNLVIIGITVVLAMQFGIYSFLAVLVGTLSIIIITMINAVTEAFGITKNHYGQKVK
jgi:hypothetical protein